MHDVLPTLDELTSKLDRVNELGLIIPTVYNGFQSVLKEQWNRMSVQRLIDIISELTDVDTKTLVDIYRNRRYHESGPRHITSSETTAHEILRKLEFDRDLMPEDVECLLRRCTVSAQQQIQPHRLRSIQDNSRIRAWLSVDSPPLLLVNGNAASHLDSTTAFFCAKVTNTLMHHVSQPHRNIEIVPLVYFCGQHQDYQKNVAAGPETLTKSLLAQLVNTHKGFEAQDLQECLEATVPGDLGSILNSLTRLLGHLSPSAMVFVIIDGMDHFSQPEERREGVCEVVNLLVHIFREQRGPVVKLLFTSAQKALGLKALGSIMDNESVDIASNLFSQTLLDN